MKKPRPLAAILFYLMAFAGACAGADPARTAPQTLYPFREPGKDGKARSLSRPSCPRHGAAFPTDSPRFGSKANGVTSIRKATS